MVMDADSQHSPSVPPFFPPPTLYSFISLYVCLTLYLSSPFPLFFLQSFHSYFIPSPSSPPALPFFSHHFAPPLFSSPPISMQSSSSSFLTSLIIPSIDTALLASFSPAYLHSHLPVFHPICNTCNTMPAFSAPFYHHLLS